MAGALLAPPLSTAISSFRLDIPSFLKHPGNERSFYTYPRRRRCRTCRADSELNSTESSASSVSSPILDESTGTKKHMVAGTQNGQILVDVNGHATSSVGKVLVDHISLTGGAFDFRGATEPLVQRRLPVVKKIVLVRHGLSSWNEDNRIQGSSDASVLSEKGALQVMKCKKALDALKFDQCFSSPISRAKSSAELIWAGREEPLVFLDTLREAHLQFLEGMKNADAKQQFPEVFKAWREDPVNFHIDGVYPVVELWGRARKAWEEILLAEGQTILVVTHKSILRALVCTALGMGPDRFRSVDINNCGISTFTINKRGEPMLQNLNMTAHLHTDGSLNMTSHLHTDNVTRSMERV